MKRFNLTTGDLCSFDNNAVLYHKAAFMFGQRELNEGLVLCCCFYGTWFLHPSCADQSHKSKGGGQCIKAEGSLPGSLLRRQSQKARASYLEAHLASIHQISTEQLFRYPSGCKITQKENCG